MIRVEVQKQALRIRTYVALGLMVAIPTIMTIAFKTTNGPANSRDKDLFALATNSGLNMAIVALASMSSFLLPVVVAVFAGSSVAEEASWGTLRYLLVRPVGRHRVLVAKLIVSGMFAIIAVLLIIIAGVGEGVLAFGWDTVFTPSATTLTANDAFYRLLLAACYVAWCMGCILACGFMLSTWTTSSMAAVSGTIGLAVVSQILDAIQPLGNLRSVLPTHYWHSWENLFSNVDATDAMVRGVALQVPYVIVFLALAFWWFNRKDIVT